jgi:hypothetical protein
MMLSWPGELMHFYGCRLAHECDLDKAWNWIQYVKIAYVMIERESGRYERCRSGRRRDDVGAKASN